MSGAEPALGTSVLLGELACLTSALCWPIALVLFRGPIGDYGARAVNLAKCTLAALLLGATTLVLGQLPVLAAAPPRDLIVLAASGVVGMAIGDSALFASVHRLGVYRTLLLQTSAPVFAAALAMGVYGERPRTLQLLGAAVILAGVTVVVLAQRRQLPSALTGAWTPLGVALALLAALGQGAGVVLSKDGMASVPFLAASFLRLTAAAVGIAVILFLGGRLLKVVGTVGRVAAVRRIVAPTFLGTYIAVLFMMFGIANAPASIAAVLLATTPVFSLFIDARLAGKVPSLGSLAGTLLAVAGVGLLALASS